MCETIKTKICTKCNESKFEHEFYKRKASPDGLSYKCRDCEKSYQIENRDRRLEKKRQWYQDHKDYIASYNKKYNEESKDKIVIKNKEWRDKNRTSYLNYKKNYRQQNKKKILEYQRKYSKTDIGKAIFFNASHTRRTKIKQGFVSSIEILALKRHSKSCYWCNESLKNKQVHIDHYIPLSKGGEHTLSNLVVSCQRCNNRKYSKDPIEFANSIGKLL